MAAAGFTPISLYYSSTTANTPIAPNLTNGELAINIADGKLFYKDSAGAVQLIATKSATAGIFLGTGAITIPAGTTAQQPTGVQGMLRFNTSSSTFEGFNGAVWGSIGGGGSGSGGTVINRTDFFPSAGTTVITVTYALGTIDVFRNGIKLAQTDFTATNGTSVTLASPTVGGDVIECMVYTSITNGTAVTSFSGGSTGLTPATGTTGPIILGGTLAIANGGTNSTATPTAGGIGYGTGTAHAYTTVGTSGQPLVSAGAGAPAFGSIALGVANTNVSGALTATNGGTGVAGTLTGILYANATGAATVASTAQVLSAAGTIPVANGGTGTTTPSLVAGTNVTITGTWPNQTIAAAGGGGGGLAGIFSQQFTATGVFTIPTGVTAVKVIAQGGGGYGIGGYTTGTIISPGGGGGAGGCAIKYLTGLTPGNTLNITFTSGGNIVTVSSGTQVLSSSIVANQGSAATNAGTALGSKGGAGGSASGGDINITGNAGQTTSGINLGSVAITSYSAAGGNGAASLLGGGGTGGSISDSSAGGVGTGYGAGGGGGYATMAGSSGGSAPSAAIAIFEW